MRKEVLKMKRKNGLFLGLLLACLVAMFLLPAGVMADSEETINLKFSTWHAPAGREVKNRVETDAGRA